MNVFRMAWAEMGFRKANALSICCGLAAVVSIVVGVRLMEDAATRETSRITRDLGFNLRILPKATDMAAYWFDGYSREVMSEDTVQRLASQEGVFMSYNHLMASLKGRYALQGREILLVGIAPTLTSPDKRKRPMGFEVAPETLHVGYVIAEQLGLKEGETVTLRDQVFTVARVLVEYGTEEDTFVYGALKDVQALLDQPGMINEIRAIDCLCLTADQDPVRILREHLEQMLPEAKVIQDRIQADARARQRQMIQGQFEILQPFLILAVAVWTGVLMFVNVRDRRHEIGVFRALGYGSGAVATLFLCKAMCLGVLGAVLGFFLGHGLALSFGPKVFLVTAKAIQIEWIYLLWAIVLTPCVGAVASFIPAMWAVTQDPADTLRED